MGWEERNGRRYYYAKRREGGRVVSQYAGYGPAAEGIAKLQEQDNRRRALWRERDRAERAVERAVDRQVDEVCALARAVASAALLTSGYHQHKGQWRRRSDHKDSRA